MTTFDFIRRSDELLAPPKYHFKTYTRTSHGSNFSVGTKYGIEDMPWFAISVNVGIGILNLQVVGDAKKTFFEVGLQHL